MQEPNQLLADLRSVASNRMNHHTPTKENR
jgi:hypothetical protein